MRVKIAKCVWNEGIGRTLAPGEVVQLADFQGNSYIKAGYGVLADDPVETLDEPEAD